MPMSLHVQLHGLGTNRATAPGCMMKGVVTMMLAAGVRYRAPILLGLSMAVVLLTGCQDGGNNSDGGGLY